MVKIAETRLTQSVVAFVAVIVLVALGCCVPAIGAETPGAAFIAAAVQQQESAPIDVVFTISSKGSSDADETKDYIESHYIRTSEALWITEKLNVATKETTISSYDRAQKEQRSLTTFGNGRVQAHIYHGMLVGALQQQSLPDPARLYLSASSDNSTTFLYEWIKQATVSPEMETIDGHPCWKLEVDNPTPNAEKFEIWVDPTIGFCPRQVQITRTGIGLCRISFSDYVEAAPNVWLPKLQVLDSPKTNLQEAITVWVRVKELKSGVKPDKASLIVKIPSGTRLYVDDMSEPIQAP